MPPAFDREFPATLSALAEARAHLRSWLAEAVDDEVVANDLLNVAGEFFLHVAVRTGGERGRARVEAERGRDGVRLAVTAVAPAATATVRSLGLPADPLGAGAIGRRLVDGCCDEVEIDRGPTVAARCWRTLEDARA
jgi:anti-sigma regulatory factor (Ser/Thr protein kinase)